MTDAAGLLDGDDVPRLDMEEITQAFLIGVEGCFIGGVFFETLGFFRVHLKGGATDDQRAMNQRMTCCFDKTGEMAGGVCGEAVADGEEANGFFRCGCRRWRWLGCADPCGETEEEKEEGEVFHRTV